jgi:hypothetical protein
MRLTAIADRTLTWIFGRSRDLVGYHDPTPLVVTYAAMSEASTPPLQLGQSAGCSQASLLNFIKLACLCGKVISFSL